jgi:predicted kinase
VLLCGLPGAGKTTLARSLAPRVRAAHIESDRFRRQLFGEPVFSSRENDGLFRAIQSATRRLLQDGVSVVVDATNLTDADRTPFQRIAEAAHASLTVVAVEAPGAVIEARLEARSRQPNGYSYADVDVYHRMRGRVQPIDCEHIRIDTSEPGATEAALTAIEASILGLAANRVG